MFCSVPCYYRLAKECIRTVSHCCFRNAANVEQRDRHQQLHELRGLETPGIAAEKNGFLKTQACIYAFRLKKILLRPMERQLKIHFFFGNTSKSAMERSKFTKNFVNFFVSSVEKSSPLGVFRAKYFFCTQKKVKNYFRARFVTRRRFDTIKILFSSPSFRGTK